MASLARQRSPSPAVVAAAAATATDGGGRARQIVAPHRPVNLHIAAMLKKDAPS
jgi:hypothetical protein